MNSAIDQGTAPRRSLPGDRHAVAGLVAALAVVGHTVTGDGDPGAHLPGIADRVDECRTIDVQDRGPVSLPVVLALVLGPVRAHRVVRRVLAVVAAVDVQVVPGVDVRCGSAVIDVVLDGDFALGDDRRGEAYPARVALDFVGAQLVRGSRGARGGGRPGARAGGAAIA